MFRICNHIYSIIIIMTKEIEALTLKDSKEGYMGRKGKGKYCNYILILKKIENFKATIMKTGCEYC